VEATEARLRPFEGRLELRQGNFADLADWLEPGSCDGVFFDLGVSSPQLDRAERGFSFQQDGPLDMRMDTRQSLTAADLVNTAAESELAKTFWNLGNEPQARRFAAAIVNDRVGRRFESTQQLASLIERLAPRRGKRAHPATRVFQALRMAVNDELGSLRKGLTAGLRILKTGGRLAVITFHSVEDRVVKEFGQRLARDYTFTGDVDVPDLRQPCAPQLKWVQRKAIKPSTAELARNPRSRSAQLRVMEKL
jgi:16S rRNA (cytosine1402-N4)-methyltransferase